MPKTRGKVAAEASARPITGRRKNGGTDRERKAVGGTSRSRAKDREDDESAAPQPSRWKNKTFVIQLVLFVVLPILGAGGMLLVVLAGRGPIHIDFPWEGEVPVKVDRSKDWQGQWEKLTQDVASAEEAYREALRRKSRLKGPEDPARAQVIEAMQACVDVYQTCLDDGARIIQENQTYLLEDKKESAEKADAVTEKFNWDLERWRSAQRDAQQILDGLKKKPEDEESGEESSEGGGD